MTCCKSTLRLLCSLLFALLLTLSGCASQQESTHQMMPGQAGTRHGKHSLMVFYDAKIGKTALLKEFDKMGCKDIYEYRLSCGFAVQIPKRMTLRAASKRLGKVKGVTHVARNRMAEVH